MLDSLRNLSRGWLVQLLLAILVVSFAVWGVADVFTGFGQNAVARVGNTDISVQEFQRNYQIATQNAVQQYGNLTPQQLVQAGLPSKVLDELMFNAALTNAAERMGLGLSNNTLGRQIAQDPAFQAPTGQFDRQYLSQIIAAQQMTENQFIADRRAAYTRGQILLAFGSGNSTPQAFLQALHDYRDVQRKVSYVMVLAPTPDEVGDPSDADLSAFFDAHKQAWAAPEYRAVNFFVLSPQDLAQPDQVTDEEARARYNSTPDAYRVPAQRQVEQVVFKDQADAEMAKADLAAGKSFEDIAMAHGFQQSDYDLGFVTKDKIVDPAVANAAFSIPENSVSDIVMGRFGPVIVKVKGVQDEIVISFDDSKADIKQRIALDRASADILSIRDAIEDARAGGATLAEAAAKYDLKLTAVPMLDQSGNDPNGNPVGSLPVAVLTGAFAAMVGAQNDPVSPDPQSYAWFEVTGVTPPHDRTLADVHDKVAAAWKDDQRQKALDAKTADFKKRLDNGETIEAVAADQMLMVNSADMITRLTQPSGVMSTDGLNAIFNLGKGQSGTAPGAVVLTSLIFTVDDVVDPPFDPNDATLASLKAQLNGQLVNDILAIYADQVQKQTTTRINQAALAAAVGVTTTQ